MYRLSNNRTAWYGSTTPLVKVEIDETGKEKEVQVLFTPKTKKVGEPFLEELAEFLNQKELEKTLDSRRSRTRKFGKRKTIRMKNKK